MCIFIFILLLASVLTATKMMGYHAVAVEDSGFCLEKTAGGEYQLKCNHMYVLLSGNFLGAVPTILL